MFFNNFPASLFVIPHHSPACFSRIYQTHIQCPGRHYTHNFLACDVHSACWARTRGLAVECTAPMTPLPPSFTCANQIERVPYTLVCDYRQDCADGSDENFCDRPPCGLKQLRCLDQSVFVSLFSLFMSIIQLKGTARRIHIGMKTEKVQMH